MNLILFSPRPNRQEEKAKIRGGIVFRPLMGWELLRELPSSAFTRSSGIPFHCFTQTLRIVTHKSGYALNRERVGNSLRESPSQPSTNNFLEPVPFLLIDRE